MNTSIRSYKKTDSIVFAKTKEPFGGLSNMAAGFPLFVNNNNIRTSEALYQACKFPLFPEIQQEIIEQKSPKLAKEISRKYPQYVRQDWDTKGIKFLIMDWCLRVKLLQNYALFSRLLLETEDLPIVEYSNQDAVWGALDQGNGELVGINALGRLLMKLRDEAKKQPQPTVLLPPNVHGFLLYNNPIDIVHSPEYYFEDAPIQYA